jgi:hypothetical protein
MSEGERLLQRLAAGDVDERVSYELLGEIFSGFDLRNLRRILGSEKDAAVESAAWILSELGPEARPLLPEATRLLEHRALKARFFALDVVLTCAGGHDLDIIAKAVTLIEDPEPAVQWKSMRFLAAVSRELLGGARRSLPERLRPEVDWILNLPCGPGDVQALHERLGDQDPTSRRFAAVAGVRSTDRAEFLRVEAQSADTVIRDFALSLAPP